MDFQEGPPFESGEPDDRDQGQLVTFKSGTGTHECGIAVSCEGVTRSYPFGIVMATDMAQGSVS